MSTILVIDTASSAIAMALAVDGVVVGSSSVEGGHNHSRLLLPGVEALLGERKADLASVGVVQGPGSYAGLRVGIAAAQGMAMAFGVPLRGVTTMEAVAKACGLEEFTAIHPAGRGVLARQAFVGGKPSGALESSRPEELSGLTLAGEGAGVLGGVEVSPEARVRAALALLLPLFAELGDAKGVDAVYLREPNITVSRRPLNAAAG